MFSFKNFLKGSAFILSILFLILLVTGISYYAIDYVQKKNNLMDIEEYSPIASLVVEENIVKKSKYPFIDVHSHQWDMSYSNLKKLEIFFFLKSFQSLQACLSQILIFFIYGLFEIGYLWLNFIGAIMTILFSFISKK